MRASSALRRILHGAVGCNIGLVNEGVNGGVAGNGAPEEKEPVAASSGVAAAAAAAAVYVEGGATWCGPVKSSVSAIVLAAASPAMSPRHQRLRSAALTAMPILRDHDALDALDDALLDDDDARIESPPTETAASSKPTANPLS